MKKIKLIIIVFLLIILGSCTRLKIKDLKDDYPKNDVYYSLFVRSFADSDGDGIGDLNGITNNLNYFNELGVTALWLLPVNPSPTYHGYDVLDYYNINSDYGTLDDFKNLVKEASKKGIKIIIDLVINHTSDQHPWFIDAKSSRNSEYRDYYLWLNENTAYQSFVGGMVDLNLANPKVKEEIKKIVDFYLEIGVHGFRLDAAKHFFDNPNETATNSKNLIFLSELNSYIKEKDPHSYVVGEVFDYDNYLTSNYFGTIDAVFNFYLQSQIIEKVLLGSSSYLLVNNIIRSYKQKEEFDPNFVDALFIGNHDLDRIASQARSEERLKLAAKVLLTLPGNPFIYYGDELGLKGFRYEGDKIDGRTVYDEYRRQPFLWGDERTTTWLSSDGSNKQTESYLTQKEDPNSMYNTYKDLLKVRNESFALMYGNIILPFKDNNGDIQGYIIVIDDKKVSEAVLVIHNVSSKTISLDISYEKILYGSLDINSYDTSIFKININKLEDYTNVSN